jgi:hypothetical protein
LVNRPFFARQGIEIDFCERISDRIYNCDILFINSKFFRKWHSPEKIERFYEVLGRFKKKINKIIWFDTTDSTGTTQFNVMPYVDGYYKGQVLKDRSLYAKTFYGYRIFADYYKKLFGMEAKIGPSGGAGQSNALSAKLEPEHAHKLGVSWNGAMYEWNRPNPVPLFKYLTARHLPFKIGYTVSFSDADRDRRLDIQARIGLSHTRDAVRYQRERIAGILGERFNIDSSKIPHGRYLNEIKDSKIGVSPFGLGEITCRDFEIIINGAILFKQDMSHLETWPPLYVNDETYVPFSWDLKDFEERLTGILKDRERMLRIRKRAQELYGYYLYGDGRPGFCDRVLAIIG